MFKMRAVGDRYHHESVKQVFAEVAAVELVSHLLESLSAGCSSGKYLLKSKSFIYYYFINAPQR